MMVDDFKVIARNKKARHDYSIEETYETGIVLQGTEVKSIRAGRVNLKDSYAQVRNGEVFLYNVHISPYTHGNRENHEPERPRKLLLHKREIRTLIGKTRELGYTLVPLSLYWNGRHIKVELALAKGKKQYDKRRELAKKTAQREMERAFKEKQYY
ncbi:MAG: SsrA-binding protein SmpB [Halanaerobium sp.]|nr:SsrA-binding protein SmpB [Halanaerobium sp.]